MLNYLLCIFLSVGLTFSLERLLKPSARWVWKNSYVAFLMHLGLCLLMLVLIILVFHRVYFASMCLVALFLVLVLVNNAKYVSLREVFVFQDMAYFTDAIKYPRLYIPFLGLGRFLFLVGLFCGIIYFDLKIEPSLLDAMGTQSFYSFVVGSFFIVLALLTMGYFYLPSPTFDPTKDLLSLGFLSSLVAYAVAEQKTKYTVLPKVVPRRPSHLCPNLLVVQSESFFDARSLYAGISPAVLTTFDKIKAASLSTGRVKVPAWGANTVRTEFSFLSGLDLKQLGVHQFNPYRKMVKQEISTLASELRQLGYYTICIHPYSKKFYSRHKVYPLMGFDEFIDIRAFNAEDYFGPYISDLAVAKKITRLFDKHTDKPLFVFTITMENHGPLHLEQVNPGDEQQLYREAPPKGCDDLTLYLRHLSNADKMIAILWNKLNDLSKESVFCWYGDHVPIMSKVYSTLTMPDGATDYFLWSNRKSSPDGSLTQDIAIHELSHIIKSCLFSTETTGDNDLQ